MIDGDLVRRAAKGDELAFELLYRRHRDAVYRFAWVITRSTADAEDAVQECFLTLSRKAASFDAGRAQFRTWLLGIVRNMCQRRRRADPDEEFEDAAADSDVESALIREETDEAVRR